MRSVSDLYAPMPVETEPEAPEPRRRSLPFVLVGIAVAALLVVGIAATVGNSGDSKVKDPVALLTGAPDAVRDKGSAHIAMNMAMTAGGRDIAVTADGAIEFATNRAQVTMKLLGIEIEMVSDGDTMYMKMPQGAGAPKPWVAFSLGDGQGGTAFAGADSPAGLIELLRGVGSDVQDLGKEDVNGVSTTHFHAVVDLKKAIERVPAAQRAQAEQSLSQFDQLGTAQMPIDAWVSDDGLPIRQVITFGSRDATGPLGPLSMKMTVDLTDFGEPVDVQVPPADQVQRVDDPSRLGQLFGGGTTD